MPNQDLLTILRQRQGDSLAEVFPVERDVGNSQIVRLFAWPILQRAPRIISKSQKFCRHKEAAKEAAEKKNAISTIEKIA